MATAASLRDIDNSPCSRDAYMHAIQVVLMEIFGFTFKESDKLIDELAFSLYKLSEEAQLLFFHSAPFDIALDLALGAGRNFSPDRMGDFRADAVRLLESRLPQALGWK